MMVSVSVWNTDVTRCLNVKILLTKWAAISWSSRPGYNKNIPPISSRNGLKIAVDVNVSLDIFKLVDIKEEDYSIEIQFQITMVWKENRVKYQNLKVNESLNALTQEDIQRLWLPRVIFENTDQKDTTRLGVA